MAIGSGENYQQSGAGVRDRLAAIRQRFSGSGTTPKVTPEEMEEPTKPAPQSESFQHNNHHAPETFSFEVDTPPFENLPEVIFADYETAQRQLQEIGLDQLTQEKGSHFDELAWTSVLREILNSDFSAREDLVKKFMAILELKMQSYASYRQRIDSTGELTYTELGQDHILTSEEDLTPELFTKHFSTNPNFRSDLTGCTEEQLQELRTAFGVEQSFENKDQIIGNSLGKSTHKSLGHIPLDPELGIVYEIVESTPLDSSHPLFAKNVRILDGQRKPIVRHVVFFEDPRHPGQVLRYSEHGLAVDQYGFEPFMPAYFEFSSVNPTPNQLTQAYIDHRTR